MKMTMHINEELLARVMKSYACESKTEAVHFALQEMDRRARLRELWENGLGFTEEELADAMDPAYDLDALRIAEGPARYGKTDSGR